MKGPPSRRRILRESAGILLASGVAGCIGGGSPDVTDDGSGGDDGTGDTENAGGQADDTTATGRPGDVACTELDDGYTHFAPGEIPMVAELDYPSALGEMEVEATIQIVAEARRPAAGSSERELVVGYTQMTDGTERSGLQGPGDDDRAVATTVDFGGEEIWVVSNPNSPVNSVGLNASLPYEVDGETLYFPTNVSLRKTITEELSGDCRDAMVAAARHIANSLEPNPDSTIAEEQS